MAKPVIRDVTLTRKNPGSKASTQKRPPKSGQLEYKAKSGSGVVRGR